MPEYGTAIEIEDEEDLDSSGFDSSSSAMSAALTHSKSVHASYKSYYRASTASIRRSTPRQVFENGRRYCNIEYILPDDEGERDRLAILHQIYTQLLEGRQTFAYIPTDVKRILDVGTGTALWANSIAEPFPNAQCIATDISTSLCQSSHLPSNVRLEVDDARLNWTYSKPFDFIHIRGLAGAITDWRAVYANAYRSLDSGGQLEVAELGPMIHYRETSTPDRPYAQDEPLPPHNLYLNLFNAACLSAARKAGIVGFEAEHIIDIALLQSVGFTIVKSKVENVPLGNSAYSSHRGSDSKAGGISKMVSVAALEGLEAMGLRLLTQHLDWEAQDVRDLCEKVIEEVKERKDRMYIKWSVVVAKKAL